MNTKESDMRRISNGKVAARWITTKHNNVFSVITSVTSKGAFYVNCCFNWVAGMALGGPLLAAGSLFNDFSMKDYLHRMKEGSATGSDKTAIQVGFAICAFNSLLCLAICFFWMHDKLSSAGYATVSAVEETLSGYKQDLKMWDKKADPDNYAIAARRVSAERERLKQAKIDARGGAEYDPRHAIFHKTALDQDWVTLFMAMAIFINAFISAWVEKEEVTVDDLDENGDVIRKNHGLAGVLGNFFSSKKRFKPVVTVRASEGNRIEEIKGTSYEVQGKLGAVGY